jgi:Sap, sulfolipid-1-addressing protein
MSPDVILLALGNAVRPTGLGAVYALLSAPAPRRLLTVYIVVGFAWSWLIGIFVVRVLHGVNIAAGTGQAVIEVVLGVAALGFAAGLATGRTAPKAHPERADERSRFADALRDPSLPAAAGAGVLTHLPGVFYLLGLNEIAATEPDLARAIADVLVFNAIWFLPAAASLLLSGWRQDSTREALGRLNRWMRSHQSALITILFSLAGAYFTLKGSLNLLG